MDAADEELVQPYIHITTLDEAVLQDISQIPEVLERSAYLDQVYYLVRDLMKAKDWTPVNPEACEDWEDKLWLYFMTRQTELNEYIPGGGLSGATMNTKLWITLGGLWLINSKWRRMPRWRELYEKGGKGGNLQWIMEKYFCFCSIPVKEHNMHELLGQLATLAMRFYEMDYNEQLEIWVRWLQTRTFELLYIVTTRELFNTNEYCVERSVVSGMYGASDSFAHETGRLFGEIMGALYRYYMYPRHLTKIWANTNTTSHVLMETPDLAEGNYAGESNEEYYNSLKKSFYEGDDGKAIIQERWSKWVDANLKPLYHDRVKHLLHKYGLVQTLRPGEMSRCKSNNMGIDVDHYEVLKRCRPTHQLDHLDYHAFTQPIGKIMDYCKDLERKTDRVFDRALLHLIDQYLMHNHEIRFVAWLVKQEHEWYNNYEEVEKQSDPILIQVMGGWDVFFRGEVYHARNLGRAFLIWCYKISSECKGYIHSAFPLQGMINEILYGRIEEGYTAQTKPDNNNSTKDDFWI